MKILTGLTFLVVAGCASAPPPPPEPATPAVPTYAIQLHRPVAIGEKRKRNTLVTSTESRVVKSGDTLLQQQHDEVQIQLVGIEKVLDVDDHGIATKLEYTVQEAFAEAKATRQDLLAPGSVLVVTRGVESPFALESGSLTPEVEKLLRILFTTSKPTRTDDDIFGTPDPQPVGGTWPIHADRPAEDLTRAGLAVEAAGLTGETELTGVETIANVECLKVTAEITAANVTPPGLQSGDNVEASSVRASFTGTFPTDPARHRLADSTEMTAELTVLRTVEERPVRTELVIRRSRRTTYTEVEPGA